MTENRNVATARELAFMDAERARDMKRRAEGRARWIDRLVWPVLERLGRKHFADKMALGPDKQDRIYHWSERRHGQRPPAELLADVLEEDEAAMGEFCDGLGYERPRKRLATDGAELARAYEDKLKALGEVGERLIRQAREEAARPAAKEWEAEETPLRSIGGTRP